MAPRRPTTVEFHPSERKANSLLNLQRRGPQAPNHTLSLRSLTADASRMVLLACYECGSDVSSAADSCPKCGAPPGESPRLLAPPHLPINRHQPAPPDISANDHRRPRTKPGALAWMALLAVGFGVAQEATGFHIAETRHASIGIGCVLLFCMLPKRAARPPKGLNPQVVCKHCHQAGHVTVKKVARKKGVSGGKATGAIMTGGWSLFAVGLSRYEDALHMRCGNCRLEWDS
jgi:hypothetical protein